MSSQLASSRSCASIWSAHSFGAISWARAVSGTSKESAREWAGSVLMIRVRCPAAAARTAVAAATVVLPTPPLPVNKRIRTRLAYRRPLGSLRHRSAGLDAGPEPLERGLDDRPLDVALQVHGKRDRRLDAQDVGDDRRAAVRREAILASHILHRP